MHHLISLAFFTSWWNELTIAKQIFYGIGMVSGLLSILLVILAVIGLEHHDGADALSGHVDDAAGGILSLKPLTGFFLGFGWVGGISLENDFSIFAATGFGLLAGGGMMALIVVMFRMILSLRSDGTMRIDNTVGCVGTVYVSLPASRASGGQVVVSFNGRQETFVALNNADRPVPSGDKVRVLQVLDTRTLLVEPLA